MTRERGNWKSLLIEYEPLFDTRFIDKNNDEWQLTCLADDGDDYYFGMVCKTGMRLFSCVGSLAGWGFTPVSEDSYGPQFFAEGILYQCEEPPHKACLCPACMVEGVFGAHDTTVAPELARRKTENQD